MFCVNFIVREFRENKHNGKLFLTFGFESETAAFYLDGVNAFEAPVRTV